MQMMMVVLQACPIAPDPIFDLPELGIGDLFPFSLITYWWGLMSGMGSGGAAPSVDTGFGVVSIGAGLAPIVSIVRTMTGALIVGGSALWFYRYITGKGSDGK